MIRSQYFKPGEKLQVDLPPERYKELAQDPEGMLWVDFEGEEPARVEPILLNTFGFHPLAVDDALHESHVPKVDDWDSYLYIVLHALSFTSGAGDIESPELDVFIGLSYIVTIHDAPVAALNRVWEAGSRDERNFKHGADHLLYRLTDELTADYMEVIESLDEEIEAVEGVVFHRPTNDVIQRVFTLKRVALHVRRFISPLREVLNKLARDHYTVIDEQDQVYFRDVYDHLVRLHDISESLRDLIGGVLDTYLSVINNRMNEIMKTLTLITTLFMPISFVAGFFGMNFFQPVSKNLLHWSDEASFVATAILMVATPGVMYLWMRRRRWM